MDLRGTRWLAATLVVASATAFGQLPPEIGAAQDDAIARLSGVQPGVRFMGKGTGLERVYGPAFGGGATPADAFNGFMAAYSDIFALGPTRLEYVGEQPLMFGKFVTGTFRQYLGSIPVDRGEVTLLARNQIGNPIVLAVNSAKPITGPVGSPRISPKAAQMNLKKHHPSLKTFEEPSLIIWSGENRPHLAWTFIASSPTSVTGCTTCGSLPERIEAFVDAQTGAILEERQAIWSIDVNGTVTAWATPGLKPDNSVNPATLQNMSGLRVNITGGNSAYTAANGTYTIPNAGSSSVTVNAQLTSRWGNVVNQAGTTLSLSQSVLPPGPANFLFNPAPDEFSTAQVNGLIHTNIVHDFAKAQNPSYPGIDIVIPINVNVSGSCNAFFNGSSINFYRAQAGGNGCPNMAYSTVIYHEYGHFIINRGGTSQGGYGEGMSDTIASLIVDHPWTGEDFSGPNTGPLRSAVNNITWPNAYEIHTAGMVVSGAFWGTMLQLNSTVGHTSALALVRQWAINSILLHPPTISPGMTIDVLTLDDNDGDITNGTPHYNEIAAGFGAKGLTAPPVEWIKIVPTTIPPAFVKWSAYPTVGLALTVTPNAGTPVPSTFKVFIRYNGSTWRENSVAQKGDNRYVSYFKRPASGSYVEWYFEGSDDQGRITRYPLQAPNVLGSHIVAENMQTVVEDFMDAVGGWTVSNTSLTTGAWVVGNPNGTNLNGLTANPEDDSNDPGVSCFFTGQGTVGGAVGDQDVDGGPTRLISPAYAINGNDAIVEYKRWFFNDDNDADALVVEVSTDNGTTWHMVETVQGIQNFWTQRSFRVGQFAPLGATVRLRFSATDNPNNSITEAAVDHLVVRRIVP